VQEEVLLTTGKSTVPLRVRGVIFDLMDTLAVISREHYKRAKLHSSSMVGVPLEAYLRAWAETRSHAYLGKYRNTVERCASVCALLNAPPRDIPSIARDIAAIEDDLWSNHVRLFDDALDCLRALKALGLKLGVVSNGSMSLRKLPASLGIAQFLRCFVLSAEVRCVKPEPAIYHKAIDQLGATASHCLFVGDGNDFELDGAAHVGLFTIKIHREPPVYAEAGSQSLTWSAELCSLKELANLLLSAAIKDRPG
jgi:putative hydrolase of the HAD superfamily